MLSNVVVNTYKCVSTFWLTAACSVVSDFSRDVEVGISKDTYQFSMQKTGVMI